jgi:hypothetical protein
MQLKGGYTRRLTRLFYTASLDLLTILDTIRKHSPAPAFLFR